MALQRTGDQLKDVVILKGVTPVADKELGRGAYGRVFTVKYCGLQCAAKEIHSILVEGVSDEEKAKIKSSFIRECFHCSLIRHPNIVQFLGVYYPKEQSEFPIMVMELMDKSLTTFIEENKTNITLYTKISILHGVTLGLCYLHAQDPPIVHRDLSSNNVLLTNHLIAKISDLGLAKMIQSDSRRTNSRLTTAPGTLHFMPPEALDSNPVYGPPVDVFSFAVITLHLFSEEWPIPLNQVKLDPKTKVLIALSEIDRRQNYLDKIPRKVISLKELVEECLSNDPADRPPIEVVCEKIDNFAVWTILFSSTTYKN